MWGPEANLPKSLTDLIKLTKGNEDCDVITYQIRDFTCLLEYEIHRMVLDGIHVKRCRNCHRYFIPERSNIEYCSRVLPVPMESSARKLVASVCTGKRPGNPIPHTPCSTVLIAPVWKKYAEEL